MDLGTVLITGAGVSGRGTATMLAPLTRVVLCDANPQALSKVQGDLAEAGYEIDTCMPKKVPWAEIDLVVTSPGWPPHAELLAEAKAHGKEIIGDVELAWRLDKEEVFGPKRTWVAITGTNGKTTTTAMTEAMLRAGGLNAKAVGNIGVAIPDALLGNQRIDVLVAELSSFQLHWTNTFTPDIGVLLNIADDHLDWHGSFAAYAAAKAKVWRAPVKIAGVTDPAVAELLERDYQGLRGQITGFGLDAPTAGNFGVEANNLVGPDGQVIADATNISPPGDAGRLDALAAAAVAQALGVQPAAIQQALSNFHVAKHRGEVVATAPGLVAVDNSKATNPHAADSALSGFANVVWVAGGQLKGADLSDLLTAHAHRLRAAVLLGVDRELFADALGKHAPEVKVFQVAETDPERAMDEAVSIATEQAAKVLQDQAGIAGPEGQAEAESQDPACAVVLAPAAASLDMYTGMGQRGDMFAAAISKEISKAFTEPVNKASMGARDEALAGPEQHQSPEV